jgi:uncharacterized membrane protein
MVLETGGPRRVKNDTSVAGPRNVGDVERWMSVLGGSALAFYGIDRGGAKGGLLALAGAELVRRGVTGHCMLYEVAGVTTADGGALTLPRSDDRAPAAALQASRAVKVEHTVVVERPRAELYAFWRDLRNLPRFMELVESVEYTGPRQARWRARGPGGTTIEWTAELINDVQDTIIAWKSVGSPDIANAGSVNFRDTPDGRGTEVRLVFEWKPPAGRVGSTVARLLGQDPDARAREDLRRFKVLMENGATTD